MFAVRAPHIARAAPDRAMVARHCAGVRRFFFVLGVQKASTTWLASMLSEASECHVAPGKEMHYWTMIDGGRPDAAQVAMRRRQLFEILVEILRFLGTPRRALAAYGRLKVHWTVYRLTRHPDLGRYLRRVMRGWRGQPVVGELTPTYCLASAETLRRMAALGEDVRFVLVLRDPVARLWSGVRHLYRGDPRPRAETANAIEARFLEALEDPAAMHYRLSDYPAMIETIESAVAADRIAYFFHETLRSPQEMARLAAFLGLSHLPCDAARRVNSGLEDGAKLRPEAAAQARHVFARSYDYIAERFPSEIPQSWRQAAQAA